MFFCKERPEFTVMTLAKMVHQALAVHGHLTAPEVMEKTMNNSPRVVSFKFNEQQLSFVLSNLTSEHPQGPGKAVQIFIGEQAEDNPPLTAVWQPVDVNRMMKKPTAVLGSKFQRYFTSTTLKEMLQLT